MRRAWPASLGALFVIAVTVSILVRDDPLQYTTTSYGILPSAYGALHDVLLHLDVPVARSFAAPEALSPDDTVWWIEPERICAKLSTEEESAAGDVPDAPAWDLAPWIRFGGTALLFASGLAGCEDARVGGLALPAPRLPDPRLPPDGEPAEGSHDEADVPDAEALARADWAPQRVSGALVPAPRSLPVPPFATFGEPTGDFTVIARVDGVPFALEAALGAGRLVLVADSVFLRNLWLDAGDAAPLAFDWVRAYGVPRLDEREHGLRDTPSTLAYLVSSPALPVFGGLAACGLLFGWAGASVPRRRVGEERPAPPTLRTYVDSLARLYARAGDHGEVFERYRDHALAELRRALNLPADAPAARVQELLRNRTGVAATDLALLRAPADVGGPAALRRSCEAIDRVRAALR